MAESPISPKKATRNKRLVLAASVVAVGAALGLGATSAAASANVATGIHRATATSVTGAKTGRGHGALARALRSGFASGPNAGQRAQKAAAALIAHPAVFSKLPAQLQADLTALKNAAPADAAADAQKIKTIALTSGYGTQVQTMAKRLQNGRSHSVSTALRTELRAAFNGDGAAAQKVAAAAINHPKLFAKLPATLQTDLKALKAANATDAATEAAKIKATALSGGYGAQVQTLAERIQKNTTTDPSSKPSATAASSTSSS